jgi:glycerol-3-phosphate dehydrogenase subunit C
MREGSLEAPTRHPLAWRDGDFFDADKIDAELRRVFDVCHGCRRCFNLCDSFPRLFDLIDASEEAELAGVKSGDFKAVVDACTLCDMCYMTKCPYVPPHPFNIDFPHLMLRYRAAEWRRGERSFAERQLAETDRNGSVATRVAPLANWASAAGNRLTRPLLERVAGVHREAALPRFAARTFVALARAETPAVNGGAPAFGRKAVLFATCAANYNNPEIGVAARRVLAHNGVATEVAYPGCCGMPQLEQGDVARVAAKAKATALALKPYLDRGFDVVALVPSCTLMLKSEWPLLVPDDEDVRRLAEATSDISDYVVGMAKKEGLVPGLKPLAGGVTVHLACHARAQNVGPKGAELMQLLPATEVGVVERCSGHGGAWGVRRENFPVALKTGRPAARAARDQGKAHVVSECPLAGLHLAQGMEKLDGAAPGRKVAHPVELLARAYGLMREESP